MSMVSWVPIPGSVATIVPGGYPEKHPRSSETSPRFARSGAASINNCCAAGLAHGSVSIQVSVGGGAAENAVTLYVQ